MTYLKYVFAAAMLFPFAALAADVPDTAALKATLVQMEKDSWVAWKGHDSKFYERFLSDDHVEVGPGGVSDKKGVVGGVAEGCTVASYSVGDFQLTVFSADAALLVYPASQDTKCGTFVVPSPVYVSSLYIFRDGRWQNAYYDHIAQRKK